MPPEGAPAVLRKQITQGRDAVVAVLAELVGSGVGGGPKSPDPELTARTISAIADEGARLMLDRPEALPHRAGHRPRRVAARPARADKPKLTRPLQRVYRDYRPRRL